MNERLLKLCLAGLHNKTLRDDQHKSRLKYELKQIGIREDEDYFLDLYDRKVKYPYNEHNLLVAYLLGLAPDFNIDLEAAWEMGEMPDADIDYLPVIQKYIKDDWAPRTFGKDNVCSVGTYGSLGIKSAILDMTKVHGVDKSEIQAITVKMEDKDDEGHPLEWDKALELYPDFAAYCDKHPDIADATKAMLDRNKTAGAHAGGLIISNQPIDKFVPVEVRKVTKDNPEGVIVSAWTEGLKSQDLQAVGLIKFDVLSIINLQQVAFACRLVKQRHPEVKSICALPGQYDWSDTTYLNDPKSIEMANKSDLRCIFQFDSEGIRKLVQRGGVDNFDDLVAYASLFRPGPLNQGMDARYCKRKKNEEDYFLHPLIEPILNSTYGVMCIHQSTLISLANGLEVPISELQIGDKVHSVNLETKKVEVKECHGCGPTRKENGYCLTLDNGYAVCLTHDHEVLTYRGMKRVDELDPKLDLVAAPEFLPAVMVESQRLAPWLGDDEDVAYLVGQLVGDGCLTSTGVTICVGSIENGRAFKEWCNDNLPKLRVNLYFNVRSWYASVSCSELLNSPNHGNRKTKLNHLVDTLGLRVTSHFKRVPPEIMTNSTKVRRAFIAGLIDSDGCVSNTCHITLDNFELLNDVRKLLAMEGIVTSITGCGIRIHVWNIEKLLNLVSNQLVLKEHVGPITDGSTVGYVPRDEIRKIWECSGLSQSEFATKTGIAKSTLKKLIPFADTSTARRIGIDLGDLRYYKIKSIEEVPNQQFYAMSVSDHHNLIANGIVVKNCYQEQVMQILHVVGDIPLIHCEKVRKAISKKKVEAFQKYKDMFLENGQRNLQANLDFVEKLWDQVVSFAEYGFNKSHATAYCYISARLLWLKAHYPLEFYTAILMCEKDTDKLKDYRVDAAAHGVEVCSVNINKSGKNFKIAEDKIYFGFSNIKRIGKGVAAEIVKGQPYKSFADFMDRYGTNATTIKALVSLGVFDELEPNHDHLTLYKFCEYYKDVLSKRRARQKRNEDAVVRYHEELKSLLLTQVKENHPNFKKMCSFTEESEGLWSEFSAVEREVPYKYKGEERIRKVTLEKLLMNLKAKYDSSMMNFQQREQESEEEEITLDNFLSFKVKVDKDLEKMLTNYVTHKGQRYYPMAESFYYGFQWSSNIERSPLYKGHTIDWFLSQTEQEGHPVAPVEVEIISVRKRTSRGEKKTEFYSVEIEDANGKTVTVNVWLDDYLRFQDELKKGNLVRMNCKPPTGGYKTLTFQSYPKHLRHKQLPKNKEDDLRLMLLPHSAEDPRVDLKELVMEGL